MHTPLNSELEESMVACLVAWIREHSELEVSRFPIDAETNLLEAGMLDSIGFLELLEFVEAKTGSPIDLTAGDLDLTSVRSLCRYLAG